APLPRERPTRDVVPGRKKAKIQNTLAATAAPSPTAPRSAVVPKWPSSAVSTSPTIGTLMCEAMAGSASRAARRCGNLARSGATPPASAAMGLGHGPGGLDRHGGKVLGEQRLGSPRLASSLERG